jgi:hypothetical protein
MNRDIRIQAHWDTEAAVWTATSSDVPGLVIEGATWIAVVEEINLALPDLIELMDQN